MSNGLLMSESFKAIIIFFKVKIVRWDPALLSCVQGHTVAEHIASYHTSGASMRRGRN